MLDYHLHLWRHEDQVSDPTIEQVATYTETANGIGIERIAITEHAHRFVQIDAVASGFWDRARLPLAEATARVWRTEQGADLDRYCTVLAEAKRAGLPVELGLEVDLLPGLAEAVGRVIADYPFDIRLGSVHWLGAWLFDAYGTPAFIDEWDHRGIERAWHDYETAMTELCDSGLCDVLAHCDLIKVAGRLLDRGARSEFEDRLAETIARSGLVVEVSSAGWRKPAEEPYPSERLLRRLNELGVAITLASDAHFPDQIGWRFDDLVEVARAAGYRSITSFEGGRPNQVPID